jgi:uncharacterized protein YcaQ
MSRGESIPRVSVAALRRLVLARSGLLRWTGRRGQRTEGVPWREQLRGEDGALDAIRRLEAVQLDPVAVVDRNHHLVLRNRVASYHPEHLEALYRRRLVFEYEANARCVVPIEDYPIFEPVRARFRAALANLGPTMEQALRYVRERLRAEGPLPARRLESADRVAGYWDLNAAKTKATSQALEYLWETGEVVVAYRQGDERYFALTIEWLGHTDSPGSWEMLLHKYLKAYGVTRVGDPHFGWRRWPVTERKKAVDRLVRQGALRPVRVEGVRRTYFVLSVLVPLLEALCEARVAPDVYLLPPLDNVLWDRERLVDLFGFRYSWEIYRPPSKRRSGPYTMPVLEGDRFIGRLDARFDRGSRALRVERLTFEPDVEPSRSRLARVWSAVEALADDLGATRVEGPTR